MKRGASSPRSTVTVTVSPMSAERSTSGASLTNVTSNPKHSLNPSRPPNRSTENVPSGKDPVIDNKRRPKDGTLMVGRVDVIGDPRNLLRAGAKTTQPMASSGLRLDLYPGDKLLVVTNADGTLTTAEAWGGPPTEQPPRAGEPFGAGPTDPGDYVIWGIEPHHVTQKWNLSRIPWGARLKVNPADYNDVFWEESPGRWRSLNATFNIPNATAFVAQLNLQLYGYRAVPLSWTFNDFGPRAVRYFVDSNKNGMWDKGEE